LQVVSTPLQSPGALHSPIELPVEAAAVDDDASMAVLLTAVVVVVAPPCPAVKSNEPKSSVQLVTTTAPSVATAATPYQRKLIVPSPKATGAREGERRDD
jgi:hypothetical protein